MNVNSLGISKLKWTGMGEFNKDDHYILPLWARIPYEKCSSHHSQQKSPKCSTWIQLKNNRLISVRFQGKQFNITVIQVYAPISNVEVAEVEQLYEDLQDLLELKPPKDILFII